MPEFINGLIEVIWHSKRGHPAYLLGKTSANGWWYFFPVAFLVKTPIPYLIFTLIGSIVILRKAWYQQRWLILTPIVFSIAIMAIVIPSSINIGLRHILPIYAMLSIIAGHGLISIFSSIYWNTLGLRIVSIGAVLWYGLTTTTVHPAYLSYFNAFAGTNPEYILVDSDLDWGQDIGQLTQVLNARNIDHIYLALFTTMDLNQYKWPKYTIVTDRENVSGWLAASIYRLKITDKLSWLDNYEPVTTIGSSIQLYYIPESVNPKEENTFRSRIRPSVN